MRVMYAENCSVEDVAPPYESAGLLHADLCNCAVPCRHGCVPMAQKPFGESDGDAKEEGWIMKVEKEIERDVEKFKEMTGEWR